MPKAVLTHEEDKTVEYLRDNSDESGRIYRKTTFRDPRNVKERNKRARLDGLLKTGDKFPVHDGAEVVYHFQIPSYALWADFKRRYPGIAKGLHSRDHITRERAAADLKRLHPDWVIAAPGKHHW